MAQKLAHPEPRAQPKAEEKQQDKSNHSLNSAHNLQPRVQVSGKFHVKITAL